MKFANNTNSAKTVKLETGDYKISWTVEAENQEGDVTEKVKLSKDAKATLKTNKEITKENKEKIKNEAKYTKEEVKRLKEQTKEKIKSLEKTNTVDIEQNEEVIQTNALIENHNREQIQSVSFAQSNVEYVNAFGEGTTLRYVMSPGKINEEIVLEAYNGFKSYSMVIDTDGLTPVKTESGRVNLTDEKGNTVVTIASPFMYDSAEKHSFDVDVTVTQESKKTWKITYTPDKEWLIDENRVYPVVIDPTVTTNEVTYQNILDVSILTGQNTGVNFDGHYLALGYQNNTEYISYIQIQSLPEFPSGAKLTGAGLVMKFTEETEFYQNIGIYAASGNMDVDNFTWSNKPTVGEFLDNQGSIPGSLWITFCSKSFGSRINNAYNNGVGTLTYAIKFTQKKQGVTNFYSADAPIVDNRPYFTISYTTEFSEVTEGKYYIRNVKSGLYLNVRNNGNVAGSQVTQMDYSAEPSQIWEIDKAGTDTYYIIPQNATNLKLYAPASGSAVVSDVDHIRNQWRFSRVGGHYTISTVNQPWVVLDVDGQSMSEGATIYPYAYHGQTNQQWELIPYIEYTTALEKGDYFIKNKSTGKYLSATNRSGAVNTSDIFEENFCQWNVTNNNDGTYCITLKEYPNNYLSAFNSISGAGRPLCLKYKTSTTSNLKMKLVMIEPNVYGIMPENSNSLVFEVYNGGNTSRTFDGTTFDFVFNKSVQLSRFDWESNQGWIFEPVIKVKESRINTIPTEAWQNIWYKFEAPVSGEFTFTSINGGDTIAYLYSNNICVTSDDNSGENSGFLIKYTLTQGNEYYLKVTTRDNAEYTLNVYRYRAYLNNYYDNGYKIRFTDGKDGSVSENIKSIIANVSNELFKIFGLELISNGEFYFETEIDRCKGEVTSENINKLCNCDYCSINENVRLDFLSNFPDEEDETVTNVLWSGHLLDENRSYSWRSNVYIFEINHSKIERVLMHELSHQITKNGDLDHYHESGTPEGEHCDNYPICTDCGSDDEKRSDKCIMYKHDDDTLEHSGYYCKECIEDILEGLNMYYEA